MRETDSPAAGSARLRSVPPLSPYGAHSERSAPDYDVYLLQPHYTVYLCNLHALLLCQRRQDPRYTLCGHCLPAARRTDHEEIVSSCHCQFRCSAYTFLASDLGKIIFFRSRSLIPSVLPVQKPISFLPFKKIHCVPEIPNACNLHPVHQGSLPGIFRRNDTAAGPRLFLPPSPPAGFPVLFSPARPGSALR